MALEACRACAATGASLTASHLSHHGFVICSGITDVAGCFAKNTGISMKFKLTLAVMALALGIGTSPLVAQAHDDLQVGNLTIHAPFARSSARSASSGAAFLTIKNTGATADRLVDARADFAMVQLHVTKVDGNGVATMQHLSEGIEIAPGATVTLEPGAMHVMFMGLKQPMREGETRRVTLVFEKAGAVEIDFPVVAAGQGGAMMGHGTMQMN